MRPPIKMTIWVVFGNAKSVSASWEKLFGGHIPSLSGSQSENDKESDLEEFELSLDEDE